MTSPGYADIVIITIKRKHLLSWRQMENDAINMLNPTATVCSILRTIYFFLWWILKSTFPHNQSTSSRCYLLTKVEQSDKVFFFPRSYLGARGDGEATGVPDFQSGPSILSGDCPPPAGAGVVVVDVALSRSQHAQICPTDRVINSLSWRSFLHPYLRQNITQSF